jgi:hypothetical protein
MPELSYSLILCLTRLSSSEYSVTAAWHRDKILLTGPLQEGHFLSGFSVPTCSTSKGWRHFPHAFVGLDAWYSYIGISLIRSKDQIQGRRRKSHTIPLADGQFLRFESKEYVLSCQVFPFISSRPFSLTFVCPHICYHLSKDIGKWMKKNTGPNMQT